MFLFILCVIVVESESASVQQHVTTFGSSFSIDCSSNPAPVWLRDDNVAQTLAIGDRKTSRFTDER